MNTKSVAQFRQLAEHYKAIGQEQIYIPNPSLEDLKEILPRTTSLETGGMYRHNVCVGVYVICEDPSGLTFRVSIDLEEKDSNGAAALRLNAKFLSFVGDLLPPPMREKLVEILHTCLNELRKQREEAKEHFLLLNGELTLMETVISQWQ